MSRWLLALAGLLLPAMQAAAQPRRDPVSESRVGADGVEWLYEEAADPITDRWVAQVVGTIMVNGQADGPAVILRCIEGERRSIRFNALQWRTDHAERWPLTIRIDRDTPFAVQVLGHPQVPNTAFLMVREEADAVIQGLASARERLAVQDGPGATFLFPMGRRPEVARAIARCAQLEGAAAP